MPGYGVVLNYRVGWCDRGVLQAIRHMKGDLNARVVVVTGVLDLEV